MQWRKLETRGIEVLTIGNKVDVGKVLFDGMVTGSKCWRGVCSLPSLKPEWRLNFFDSEEKAKRHVETATRLWMKAARGGGMLQGDYQCRGCGGAPDAPQMKDDVWRITSKKYPRNSTKHDLLCISCVEKALGRNIGKDDLTPCVANAFALTIMERYTVGNVR